jgi:hypothetical protein
MLLRMECSEAELAALRAAGPPRRYEGLDATSPLVGLVARITQGGDHHFIRVQKGELSLTLARGTAPADAPPGSAPYSVRSRRPAAVK